MKLKVASGTDTGLKRKINEDAYLVREDLGLFIVADGMGGHRAGEVASRMVVDTISECWTRLKTKSEPFLIRPVLKNISEKAKNLVNFVYIANKVVHEAQKNPEYFQMGSTVSVIATEKEIMWLVNVGDSPVYQLSNGRMTLISEVHSIAAEQRRMGIDNSFGSSNPLMKNILTRVIGINDTVDVYVKKIVPEAGDMILICSDGLVNYLPEKAIRSILANLTISLEEKVKALIDEANNGGGGDNITVILIEILKEIIFKKFLNKFKS
ncbi:MAG: serine/threonine-protein phosphatase [Deltaproteobacteria bacterium]|nr:serine/threonine-protein phosphatase [Deltaproteobacteria bacterium]